MAEENAIRNERGRHLVGFARQQRKAIMDYLGDRPVTLGSIYRGGRPYLPSMDSVLYLEGIDDVKYSSVEESNGRIEFGWAGHEEMMIRDRVLLVLNTINDSVTVPKKTALEAERLIKDFGMLDFGYVIGEPFNIMTLRDLYTKVGMGDRFSHTVASLRDEKEIQEYIRRFMPDILSFLEEDEVCVATATRKVEGTARKIASKISDCHNSYMEGPVLIDDSGKRPPFNKGNVKDRKVLILDIAVWMAPEFPEEILRTARNYKGTFDMKGLAYLTSRGLAVIGDKPLTEETAPREPKMPFPMESDIIRTPDGKTMIQGYMFPDGFDEDEVADEDSTGG
jgi:hypothetical protein